MSDRDALLAQAVALREGDRTEEARESVALLLKLLATSSGDERVRRYRRAIEFYAEDLDAVF